MSNRLTRPIAVLMAISMLAFGVGRTAQARTAAHPGRALTHVTLQLKWVPQAQFGGYYVALDKGFYRQAGLDVTIKAGGPQIAPETVVDAGGADFGIDWLSALLAARDKGVPIVNIAQIYQATGMRLITFKSSGITDVRQFRGHKIGVWPSGNEYQFYALMNKLGYTPARKFVTVVGQTFTMDQFLGHQIDVAHAMTYNELGVVLEHGVPMSRLRVFDYNKLGIIVLEDGIFAKQGWLASHRQIAVKFLRASIRGWQYAVAHPDQAGRISFSHAQPGSTTQAHQIYMARNVAQLIKYGPGAMHTIGYMSPSAFQTTWSILLQQHIISKRPTFAYNQSYWRAAGGH
ncbi:MAG TPA: ABC transporter substrate-binding protein [Chloroflexota bacterium]